jgi:hypothetical protein
VSVYAFHLRNELSVRNEAYAASRKVAHVSSYGAMPVMVYEPFASGEGHGNFLNASYRAILANPEWKRRLKKVHTQTGHSLPRADRRWRELDSCMSSDALLMNIFCHPRTMKCKALCSTLGIDEGLVPRFGFSARVPLANGNVDRTEIDMKVGPLLVEAKLTESDFQTRAAERVNTYRDLNQVFCCPELPRVAERYGSYQLIRNVLAAHTRGLSFCVLLDSRRPDLLEAWYCVMKCVRIPDLRTQCKVLTWQELSQVLSSDVQEFLKLKYGIVPAV